MQFSYWKTISNLQYGSQDPWPQLIWFVPTYTNFQAAYIAISILLLQFSIKKSFLMEPNCIAQNGWSLFPSVIFKENDWARHEISIRKRLTDKISRTFFDISQNSVDNSGKYFDPPDSQNFRLVIEVKKGIRRTFIRIFFAHEFLRIKILRTMHTW